MACSRNCKAIGEASIGVYFIVGCQPCDKFPEYATYAKGSDSLRRLTTRITGSTLKAKSNKLSGTNVRKVVNRFKRYGLK